MAFNVPPVSLPNFPILVYEPREADHWPKWLDASDYKPERAVSRAAEAGAICVKAFVESGFGIFIWPYLHTDTLQKIQAGAREHSLVLIVHANSVDSWSSALDSHADIIVARTLGLAGRSRKFHATSGSEQSDCRRGAQRHACTAYAANCRR